MIRAGEMSRVVNCQELILCEYESWCLRAVSWFMQGSSEISNPPSIVRGISSTRDLTAAEPTEVRLALRTCHVITAGARQQDSRTGTANEVKRGGQY